MRELLVATAPTGDGAVVLDYPPLHPARHGVLRIRLEVPGPDDGAAAGDARVAAAEVVPGFMHRGAEKLMEVRDHRGAMALANRHDWLSPVVGELTVALAMESLLGLPVPERATWLRTLLVELTRLTAGLVWVGAPGHDVPHEVPRLANEVREDVLRLVESLTGARMHVGYARVGGVAAAPPDGWCDDVVATLDRHAEVLDRLAAWTAGTGAGSGVAVVSREAALGHGASGPVARASGLDVDLRRDAPTLAYPDLAGHLDVPVGTAGDARERRRLLAASLPVAARLAAACAERVEKLDGLPVAQPLPKVLRLPVGAAWAALEGPFGVAGVHLESRGEATPHRLKLRTPGFAHASLLGTALAGTRIEDLPVAVASFFLVVGDVDR